MSTAKLTRGFETLTEAEKDLAAPFLLPPIYDESWYYLPTVDTGAVSNTDARPEAMAVNTPTPGTRPACVGGHDEAHTGPGWDRKRVTAAGLPVSVWWHKSRRPNDVMLVDLAVEELPYIAGRLTKPPPAGVGMKTPPRDTGDTFGRCEGPDDDLDVFVVSGLQAPGATTGHSGVSPTAFINIDRQQTPEGDPYDHANLDLFKTTLAHEYMHATQWSYKKTELLSRDPLMEATATWAEHVVYPALNSEHARAWHAVGFHRFDRPLDMDGALPEVTNADRYDAYLFFLFIAGQDSSRLGVVSEIWDTQQNREPTDAINHVLAGQGGLERQWHAFAQQYWGESSFDTLAQWDPGLPGAANPFYTASRDLLLAPRARVDHTARDMLLGRDLPSVEPLAAAYVRLDLSDPFMRAVYVGVPSPVPTGVKVTLLVLRDNGSWESMGTLTGKENAALLCRDKRPEDDVSQMALVVSNAMFGDDARSFPLEHVEVRGHRACKWPRLVGTATATYEDTGNEGYYSYQKLTVEFDSYARCCSLGMAWDEPGVSFDTEAQNILLFPVKGTVEWEIRTVDDSGQECHDGGTTPADLGLASVRVQWTSANTVRIQDPSGQYGVSAPLPTRCDSDYRNHTEWGMPWGRAPTYRDYPGQGQALLSGSFGGEYTSSSYSSSWNIRVAE